MSSTVLLLLVPFLSPVLSTSILSVSNSSSISSTLDSTFPSVSNTSLLQLDADPTNGTEHHNGFLHGFVESLSVILVSELGDKTFFIAAILAMTNNKLTVFLAAMSALALMTVLSAVLGFVVTTFIPRMYTYYTCTAIMFLFGIKMLWEAWRMKTTEGEETQREVEEEIARRGSSLSVHEPEEVLATEMAELNVEALDDVHEEEEEEDSKPKISFRKKMREKSWFGKKCVKIFKLFTNSFAMTFLAEWGDRSQLATIVMAGINDVAGVCLGGVLGHFICTGLAVICGALIAKKISVRMVTLVGALVFLGFAVASLFIDPYEENLNVPEIEGDGVNSTDFSVQSSFLVRDMNMMEENTQE